MTPQERVQIEAQMLQEMARSPNDTTAAGAYRDLLKDDGQDSLAELVSNLDGLIMAALQRNLQIRLDRRTQWIGSRDVLTGYKINILWQGFEVASANIEII